MPSGDSDEEQRPQRRGEEQDLQQAARPWSVLSECPKGRPGAYDEGFSGARRHRAVRSHAEGERGGAYSPARVGGRVGEEGQGGGDSRRWRETKRRRATGVAGARAGSSVAPNAERRFEVERWLPIARSADASNRKRGQRGGGRERESRAVGFSEEKWSSTARVVQSVPPSRRRCQCSCERARESRSRPFQTREARIAFGAAEHRT